MRLLEAFSAPSIHMVHIAPPNAVVVSHCGKKLHSLRDHVTNTIDKVERDSRRDIFFWDEEDKPPAAVIPSLQARFPSFPKWWYCPRCLQMQTTGDFLR